MSSRSGIYARVPQYTYQKIDTTFIKFTNIPLYSKPQTGSNESADDGTKAESAKAGSTPSASTTEIQQDGDSTTAVESSQSSEEAQAPIASTPTAEAEQSTGADDTQDDSKEPSLEAPSSHQSIEADAAPVEIPPAAPEPPQVEADTVEKDNTGAAAATEPVIINEPNTVPPQPTELVSSDTQEDKDQPQAESIVSDQPPAIQATTDHNVPVATDSEPIVQEPLKPPEVIAQSKPNPSIKGAKGSKAGSVSFSEPPSPTTKQEKKSKKNEKAKGTKISKFLSKERKPAKGSKGTLGLLAVVETSSIAKEDIMAMAAVASETQESPADRAVSSVLDSEQHSTPMTGSTDQPASKPATEESGEDHITTEQSVAIEIACDSEAPETTEDGQQDKSEAPYNDQAKDINSEINTTLVAGSAADDTDSQDHQDAIHLSDEAITKQLNIVTQDEDGSVDATPTVDATPDSESSRSVLEEAKSVSDVVVQCALDEAPIETAGITSFGELEQEIASEPALSSSVAVNSDLAAAVSIITPATTVDSITMDSAAKETTDVEASKNKSLPDSDSLEEPPKVESDVSPATEHLNTSSEDTEVIESINDEGVASDSKDQTLAHTDAEHTIPVDSDPRGSVPEEPLSQAALSLATPKEAGEDASTIQPAETPEGVIEPPSSAEEIEKVTSTESTVEETSHPQIAIDSDGKLPGVETDHLPEIDSMIKSNEHKMTSDGDTSETAVVSSSKLETESEMKLGTTNAEITAKEDASHVEHDRLDEATAENTIISDQPNHDQMQQAQVSEAEIATDGSLNDEEAVQENPEVIEELPQKDLRSENSKEVEEAISETIEPTSAQHESGEPKMKAAAVDKMDPVDEANIQRDQHALAGDGINVVSTNVEEADDAGGTASDSKEDVEVSTQMTTEAIALLPEEENVAANSLAGLPDETIEEANVETCDGQEFTDTPGTANTTDLGQGSKDHKPHKKRHYVVRESRHKHPKHEKASHHNNEESHTKDRLHLELHRRPTGHRASKEYETGESHISHTRSETAVVETVPRTKKHKVHRSRLQGSSDGGSDEQKTSERPAPLLMTVEKPRVRRSRTEHVESGPEELPFSQAHEKQAALNNLTLGSITRSILPKLFDGIKAESEIGQPTRNYTQRESASPSSPSQPTLRRSRTEPRDNRARLERDPRRARNGSRHKGREPIRVGSGEPEFSSKDGTEDEHQRTLDPDDEQDFHPLESQGEYKTERNEQQHRRHRHHHRHHSKRLSPTASHNSDRDLHHDEREIKHDHSNKPAGILKKIFGK